MGIVIDHYKDPYLTTSIMESKRCFFVAHVSFSGVYDITPSPHKREFWPKNVPKKTVDVSMVFMDVMVTPDECQTSCFIWGHPPS